MKFGLVGIIGVGVNMAVFSGLTFFGSHYLVASGCSFIVAVTNNFFGNVLWAFKGRAPEKSIRTKYLSFFIISLINLGVNLLILKILVEYIVINATVAQLIAIAMVSGLNFILNYFITFGQDTDKNAKGDLKSYETDCHTHL